MDRLRAYPSKELEVEKELHSPHSMPFDLSKVHEKLHNVKTLADLTVISHFILPKNSSYFAR